MTWDDTKEDYNGSNPTESAILAADWNDMVTDQKTRATDSDLTTHTEDSTIHYAVSSINLASSQVSDFDTAISANSEVIANSAKISFDSTSSTRLANTSGTNTGDQDLSAYALTASIPTALSQLSNDTSFITDADIASNSAVSANTSKISFDTVSSSKLAGIEAGAEVNTVDSVNSKTGTVVLDADDIDDTSTTNKFVTASDITKLSNLSGTNTGDQTLPTRDSLGIDTNDQVVFDRVTVDSFEDIIVGGTLINKVIIPDSSQIAQTPIAGTLFHDLLAFNSNSVPTFEQYDGTTWSSATLNNELFAQKQDQQITVCNGTTTLGARWTWSSGISWSSARWLVIAHTYSSPSPGKNILVESSEDGITWTTLHDSTYTTTSQPVWHYLDYYGGDDYLRITILHTQNNTSAISLSSIKLLTSRWGDQGQGDEYQYPYSWDGDKNVTFPEKVFADGGVVINDNAEYDELRVEGHTDSNLLRTDATNDRVGIGIDTPTEKLDVVGNIAVSGTVDGIDIANLSSSVILNNAKVSNALHSGDVTGSTVLTIANGAVDLPMLSASGTASSSTYLRGDNSWATVSASGGATPAGLDGQMQLKSSTDLAGGNIYNVSSLAGLQAALSDTSYSTKYIYITESFSIASNTTFTCYRSNNIYGSFTVDDSYNLTFNATGGSSSVYFYDGISLADDITSTVSSSQYMFVYFSSIFRDYSGDAPTITWTTGSSPSYIYYYNIDDEISTTNLTYYQWKLPMSISGNDSYLISGTAGTNGQYATWDANGDIVGTTFPTRLADVVDDTTPTLGGTLDADGNVIVNVQKVTFDSVVANGTKTTDFTIDFDAGQKQSVTLTANTMTLTLDTTSVGVGNYVLVIINGGLATLTWAGEATSVVWPGGTAPTLTSDGVDIISFFLDGSTWYGVASLDFS